MRHVAFDTIVGAVKNLCIAAAHELPSDVLDALERARRTESNTRAAEIIDQLLENARLAAAERIPLCQDTGLAVVFVEQGSEVLIDAPGGATVVDAINAGVAAGYKEGYLRASVVAEPLKERANTRTNTPAIIHHSVVPGASLKIAVMAKGGGCENRSAFCMFKPTAAPDLIVDWVLDVVRNAGADACPPFVVGLGLGGDFELSCLLSKKALLRNLGQRHPDAFYADLERHLLERINATQIGPQGLGGDTTALDVLIETAPCHIASMPVAVNIECHSHRHKSVVL